MWDVLDNMNLEALSGNKAMVLTSIALGAFGVGLFIGIKAVGTQPRQDLHTPTGSLDVSSESESDSDDDSDFDDIEVKMVLVVNQGLGMQRGKVAAQCGHAALAVYQQMVAQSDNPQIYKVLRQWDSCGATKVAVKGLDTEHLELLQQVAQSQGLPNYLIRDAGRTQIPSGSKTVLAIGPASAELIDEITGRLKLY
eukprot:m.357691 g.357691  ORF g.357691 m.357691 type:complete len:196 (+) comp17900_c0_seq1:46-633(+)